MKKHLKLKQKILNCSLKKQMIFLFLPIMLLFILIIGICSYCFEANQVQSNTLYLINNTVLQTKNIIDEKLETVFSQVSGICDSTSVCNLFIDNYTSKESYQKYNDVLDVYNNMNRIYNTYSNMIDSMFLKTSHQTEITLYQDLAPATTLVDLDQWMKAYHTSKTGFYWENYHTDKIFKTQPLREVLTLFKITGSSSSRSKMLVACNLRPDYFLQILDNAQISKHGYMMIVSKDSVLYSSKLSPEYRLKSEDIQKIQSSAGKSGNLYLKTSSGKQIIADYHPLINNEWIITAVVPQNDLVDTFSGLRYMLLLIFAVVAAVFTLVCICLASTISQPIELLSQKVSCWQKGNMDMNFSKDQQSENEISILACGLQSLKDTVTELLQKVSMEQKQKYKMQLLAMQVQIKPHFLYNTLASVKSLADLGDNKKASEMCEALEQYYRIGVSDGKEIISVQQEVEHAVNYLRIQKMRYEKDFDYSVNVDKEIMDCSILKLTLQPLVENAIYHGIKQKEGKRIIVLTGEQKDKQIIFSVYDDGIGIDPDKLAALRKSISSDSVFQNENFGLRNVNNRLKLYYGKKASLAIDSAKGMYTEVKFIIPTDRGDE